jgi:hypothetical protein
MAFQDALFVNAKHDLDLLWPTQYGLACTALARGDLVAARHLGQQCLTTLETINHHDAEEIRQWLANLPT